MPRADRNTQYGYSCVSTEYSHRDMISVVLAIVAASFITPYSQSSPSFDSVAYHYAQTINTTDLREHLGILAADEMKGRDTGQLGQQQGGVPPQ